MKVIHERNVNGALRTGCFWLQREGVAIAPRGLPTLELPYPVATVYACPRERVLFSPERDANPFFHFMEALWILHGRRDVDWMVQWLPRFGEYSDNGSTFRGAYGWRLRQHTFDQLSEVVGLLQEDPDTRKAVLQIWDAVTDLNVETRDTPCNTTVFLKVRQGRLNITVCCRSNDVLWGAYGANAVQFSMLQEYIAGWLDVEVGTYTQISDSFHVYPDNPYWKDHVATSASIMGSLPRVYDPYKDGNDRHDLRAAEPRTPITPMRLFEHSHMAMFDNDLRTMFDTWDKVRRVPAQYHTPMMQGVFAPMYAAHGAYRRGDLDAALRLAGDIIAPDWRLACQLWLMRRFK